MNEIQILSVNKRKLFKWNQNEVVGYSLEIGFEYIERFCVQLRVDFGVSLRVRFLDMVKTRDLGIIER